MIRKRDSLYSKIKQSGKTDLRKQFETLRQKLNAKSDSYQAYLENLLELTDNENTRDSKKNINRKVQGVPQSQTAANPQQQEEEKNDKNKHVQNKQTNAREKSTRTSSLFSKRGDHNAKRNDETRGQRAREDFKT